MSELDLGNQMDATAGTFNAEEALADNMKIAESAQREAAATESEPKDQNTPAQGNAVPQSKFASAAKDSGDSVGIGTIVMAAEFVSEIASAVFKGGSKDRKGQGSAFFPGQGFTPSEHSKRTVTAQTTTAPLKNAPLQTARTSLFPGAKSAKASPELGARAQIAGQSLGGMSKGVKAPDPAKTDAMLSRATKAVARAQKIRAYQDDGGATSTMVKDAKAPTVALQAEAKAGDKDAKKMIKDNAPKPKMFAASGRGDDDQAR